jgi:2-haloalkanoic acid dehalogenase type II
VTVGLYEGVEVLSFDCYGTLIDWETGILDALRGWRERAGIANGEAILGAFGEAESENEALAPSTPYPEILSRCLVDLGEFFGTPPTADEVTAFGASVPSWPPFPDSAAALARLAEHAALVVVSNVDAGSFAASEQRLGLPFRHAILASDVRAYKPADAPFDALFALLDRERIPRSALVHVAQSLFHDHVPAARHGIRSVWIDRRGDRDGPGATAATTMPVRPIATYPSMADFADAFLADR